MNSEKAAEAPVFREKIFKKIFFSVVVIDWGQSKASAIKP